MIHIPEIPHRGTDADDGISVNNRIRIENIRVRIIIAKLFPQATDQSCEDIHLLN